MKQNAKKRLLIIFTVFLLIVIFIVLGSTVFTVQKASLVFLRYNNDTGKTMYVDPPTRYLTLSADKLIDDFKGKSIFFLSSKKLIDSVHSEYPYIKVEGVNRLFPNLMEIFVTERTPVSVISYNGAYYLADSENFVVESFNQPLGGYPVLKFSSFLSETPQVGKHLVFSTEMSWLNDVSGIVFDTLWQGGFDFIDLPDVLKAISVQSLTDYFSLNLDFNTGAILTIKQPEQNLQQKILVGWGVYASEKKDNTRFGTIIEVSEKDGQIKTTVSGN